MEIKARFDHYNINVFDLGKSIQFYNKALGMKEVRRKEASDGSFILVYLGDGVTGFTLELTWLRDWDRLIIWEIMNSICVYVWMVTTMKRGPSTKRWDVSVTKTRRWDFILSSTPTDIG